MGSAWTAAARTFMDCKSPFCRAALEKVLAGPKPRAMVVIARLSRSAAAVSQEPL
jgi:hypothetical protein